MATTALVAANSQKQASRSLASFSWAVLAFMVLVALWGAVVRATGSGAGCGANWPLCNGLVWPLHHPLLTTVIEFVHRSMSGVCTVLVIGLIAWTFANTRPGHPARRAVVASGLLLVVEALLGAVLVLKHYVESNTSGARVFMQAVHFTNTLLLLGALACAAWFLERERREIRLASANAKIPALLAIAATILVGATGALAALADTLFPSTSLVEALAKDFAAGSPFLVRMRWLHPAASILAMMFVGLLVRRTHALARNLLLATLALQILLGGLDVLLMAPAWLQVLHLLGADLFWIVLVAIAVDAFWPLASASE